MKKNGRTIWCFWGLDCPWFFKKGQCRFVFFGCRRSHFPVKTIMASKMFSWCIVLASSFSICSFCTCWIGIGQLDASQVGAKQPRQLKTITALLLGAEGWTLLGPRQDRLGSSECEPQRMPWNRLWQLGSWSHRSLTFPIARCKAENFQGYGQSHLSWVLIQGYMYIYIYTHHYHETKTHQV